jgi:hypothetical protein
MDIRQSQKIQLAVFLSKDNIISEEQKKNYNCSYYYYNSSFILFTKSSTFTGFGIKQSVSNAGY